MPGVDWWVWLRQAEAGEVFQSLSPLLSAFRDLFNAAFVSCWSELNEDQQDELIRSIELALTSQDIAEVTQTLLNLAEFMEHSDKVRLSPLFRWSPTGNQLVGGGKPPHSPLLFVPRLPFSYAGVLLSSRAPCHWETTMALFCWVRGLPSAEHMPKRYTTKNWSSRKVPPPPS